MKRLLRIVELSKNEQRVVLIIMLVVVVIALISYESRVQHRRVRAKGVAELKMSPSPAQTPASR